MESYEVQLTSGGDTYNNVLDIPLHVLQDDPYVYCLNEDQTGLGCKDWKVKYCCAQPKPKCYCCPPSDVASNCSDNNNLCSTAFNGGGTCMDITNPDWDELDDHFDLNEPGVPGACQASDDLSCCRCLKTKTCMDTGCKDAYGGNGICLETQGELMKFDLDLEAGHDPRPDLCQNTLAEDCCSCFKLNNGNTGNKGQSCKNDVCEELGGLCYMPNELPPDGYLSKFYCNENLNCKCYVPLIQCENDECKKMEGKCVLPNETPPSGYVSSFHCNEKLGCKCYTLAPPTCENNKCKNKGGKCIMPSETPPSGYEADGFCDTKIKCKCYIPPSKNDCENQKCQNVFGVCVEDGMDVPNGDFYQLATGNLKFCNKETKCKCYKPKCKDTSTCKKYGGKCFSKKIAPDGWDLVKKSGKKIVCSQKLKCYCYKQDKYARDLETMDDYYLESDEDYLEIEEDGPIEGRV